MTNENELNNLPAEVWEPLQQQEKDAEKIERPIFLQSFVFL